MKENRIDLWRELSKLMQFTVKLDGLLSAISGQPVIDLLWLDDELGKRHSEEYDPYGGKESMSEFITRKFGERANELTETLMHIPGTITDIDGHNKVYNGK